MEYVNEEQKQEERAPEVRSAGFKTPLFSIILIGSIAAVFIAELATGDDTSIFSITLDQMASAGLVKPFFWNGDYWRALTAATLHSGFIHVGFNSYALYILGKIVESFSNRAHLAIVFLIAVISGSVFSIIFSPETPSVGASGGVIGLLGYLTAYGIKRRKLLHPSFLKNMLFNIAFIGFIGVFVLPGIDNFAHLGGLLSGAVYGLVQIPSDLYKDPREAGNLASRLGPVALGLFVLTCIFTILLLTDVINIQNGQT